MSRNCICNVPGGSIVVADIDGDEAMCLKAQRLGKDFVHFYLIPLDPLPAQPNGLRLVYADPEAVVTVVTEAGIEIAPIDAAAPEVGHVFDNGAGHFLKVFDTEKTERYHAYVDLTSGEVRLRQERNVGGIFVWRLTMEPEEDQVEFMS